MGQDAPPLLVHVGYHKTATTWLQEVYFPEHPGIHFPFARGELSRILVRPHPFVFDPQEAREALMERIEPLQDGVVVLSNERFSGNPASGGIDALEIVDRLAATLPEAKIWISVREQAAMVTSYYKQFIKQGGTCTVPRFLAGDQPHKRIPYFTTDYFHYLPLVKRFQDRFGEDRVAVSLFEEFWTDRDRELARIGGFAGFTHQPDVGARAGRRNVSPSDRTIRIMRLANGILVHPAMHHHFRPLVRLPGQYWLRGLLRLSDRALGSGRKKIKPAIKEILGDRFAASNRALGEHLGKDLSKWGYVVEDA